MIYLKCGQPRCHPRCQGLLTHTGIGFPSGCFEGKNQFDPGWGPAGLQAKVNLKIEIIYKD